MTDLTQLLRSAEPPTEPGFDAHDVARRVQARTRRRVLVTSTTTVVLVGIVAVVAAGPVGSWRRPVDDVVLSQPTAPPPPFAGTWESTDSDGSSQTMKIVHTGGDSYEVVLRDDAASRACQGGPATLAGTALLEVAKRLVIAEPALTCDDGSVPALGLPPQEELAGFTLVLDPAADRFADPFGIEWRRAGSSDPSTAPPSPEPTQAAIRPTTTATTATTATSGGLWPQSTPEEVQAAQELADAGDPSVTWQLDATLATDGEPWGAEIFTRFITEELGWEAFASGADFTGFGYEPGGGTYDGVLFIRCAPGQTNPLGSRYTDIPSDVRDCAPTIDDRTYETVRFSASQPQRRHPTGIWVVDRWELLGPGPAPHNLFDLLHTDFDQRQIRQVPPPTDAEADALLEMFLHNRTVGTEAEQHVFREPPGSPFDDEPVPLLYATSTGAPYERFEVERVRGPVWPNGWLEYRVRLVADDGTVVEQLVHVVRKGEQLGLVYGHSDEPIATREDGEPLISRQRVLDSISVTAPPLIAYSRDGFLEAEVPGGAGILTMAYLPRIDCDGPPPADAAALARQVAAVPEFQATDPETVRLAGHDWLQVDLVFEEDPGTRCNTLWARLPVGDPGWRTRLLLIDQPEQSAPPYLDLLMIAVTSPAGEFDQVLDAVTPIMDSMELDLAGGESDG